MNHDLLAGDGMGKRESFGLQQHTTTSAEQGPEPVRFVNTCIAEITDDGQTVVE